MKENVSYCNMSHHDRERREQVSGYEWIDEERGENGALAGKRTQHTTTCHNMTHKHTYTLTHTSH
jgi:hypothetical protein